MASAVRVPAAVCKGAKLSKQWKSFLISSSWQSIYITVRIHHIVFSGRLTGAQGILLFYNYLPDKCLTVKPNENTNNCVKIESLTSDILDAARRIIIRKEKREPEASETSLEVDQKLAGLTSANELLRHKVTRLEQKIDEQNRKLDLILTKL